MSVKMPEPDRAVLERRAKIVAALRQIVPGEGVIASTREMRVFESDGLTAYRQLPMVVVLPETTALKVERYELPNLRALNFVVEGLLGEGVASSTRQDPQAKGLGEWLRSRQVDVPTSLLENENEV